MHSQARDIDVTLKTSLRVMKYIISSNYIMYLQESNVDISVKDDPIIFSHTINENKPHYGILLLGMSRIQFLINKFKIFLKFLKMERPFVVNGFLKSKETF
jgi:hypothetical protein